MRTKKGLKNNNKLLIQRLPLLTWLIIPLIGVWMAINFLIGVVNRPPWEIDPTGANWTVIAGRSEPQTNMVSVNNFNWHGEGLVTFWFDDAFLSEYQIAFSILDRYGFQAALAVPTSVPGMANYMNWAQIKHVQYRGWEITAHSQTHNCDINDTSTKISEIEIIQSKTELESRGINPNIYVPPCGEVNLDMKEIIKKNYQALRTSDRGYNDLPIADPYNLLIQEVRADTSEDEVLQWVDEAKNSKKWLIIMFHRLDQTGQVYTTTEARFRKIVKIVDDSNLPVVLPSQVLNIPNNQ